MHCDGFLRLRISCDGKLTGVYLSRRTPGAYNPPAVFKRVRQLRISLAAKCQLLFGAAVVLIIGAALFVPWQRMEQLTNQLNERSARTLIEYAIAEHISDPANGTVGGDGNVVCAPPTTAPASTKESPLPPPRLILAGGGRD